MRVNRIAILLSEREEEFKEYSKWLLRVGKVTEENLM